MVDIDLPYYMNIKENMKMTKEEMYEYKGEYEND